MHRFVLLQDLHNQRNKLVAEEDVVLNSVNVAYSGTKSFSNVSGL